jgi:CRISPR-associated protein Cmr1
VPPPTKNQVDHEYVMKHLLTNGKWPAGVPYISGSKIRLTYSNEKADHVWANQIKQLKEFRQRRVNFGRSKWPEPDSIRRILNKAGKYVFGRHVPAHPVQEKFPRAKFGLPIRFEFPVLPGKPDPKDPKTTTLQGISLGNDKNIDRLASPLILRPIACSDGAVGLAAILVWEPVESDERYTPPGGLLLTSKDYGDFQVESDLDVSDAKNIEPLKTANKGKPQPDVLQAFLDFLK